MLPIHDARLSNGDYRVAWPTLGRDEPTYLHLAIGPDLGEACDMPAPHFFFNAAVPRPEDVDAIDSLARCLNRPDTRDAKIQLVGHADPRGTPAYNLALARSRAEQVASLLEAHGVAPQRISIVSDGAQGAPKSQQQYSFGYDRRVDIDLDTLHRPAGPQDTPARYAAPEDVPVQAPQLPAVAAGHESVQAPGPLASNAATP